MLEVIKFISIMFQQCLAFIGERTKVTNTQKTAVKAQTEIITLR
jgi:hypothetical protein